MRKSGMARIAPINATAIVDWVNVSSRGLGVIVLVTVVQYEVRVDIVDTEEVTVWKVVEIVVLVVKTVHVVQVLV